MSWVKPVIGAVTSLGGLLAAKATNVGGPSPQQQQLLDLQTKNIGQASNYANQLFPTGTNLLNLSKSTFQAPIDYWTGLAGGSRTGATSTLAPQISQLTEANAANSDALSKLYPRSGAAPDVRAMSIYAPQKGVTSLLQTVRPEANKELTSIAGTTGSLGSYLSGDAIRGLTGATAAGSSTLDALLRQQVNQQQQQQQLGSSIGGLLYDIMKKFNFGGGGSKPSEPMDIPGLS